MTSMKYLKFFSRYGRINKLLIDPFTQMTQSVYKIVIIH